MLEILTRYGFFFTGTCDCDGAKTGKYKNGEYKIYWNKRKKAFRVKKNKITITVLLPENEIEDRLKEYGFLAKEAPVLPA